MSKVLDVKKLNKIFIDNSNKVEAVKDVSFSINNSEIMVISGRSGSGKSTLLHLLAGLEKITSGKIRFENHSFENLSLDELALVRRSSIGFVYQFHHLIPEFNALENVSMPLLLNGIKKEISYELSRKILIKFGLENRINHKPNQLSGGERQRVAISRALINNPKFVLLDEPTGDLDKENAKEVRSMLKEYILNSDASLIIATHDSNFEEISTIHKIMDSGVLV